MLDGVKSLTPGAGVTTPHPLEGFTDSMLPNEGPSQERRRLNVSAETADRASQVMQDPPTYVVISIEITLFMIGGDAEAVGALIEGGVNVVARRSGKEALPLVAGTLKRKGKKGASSGKGSTLRPGPHAKESVTARGPRRDFSRAERDAVNELGNKSGCHTCGSKEPGTKSGDFVPDHQPPSAINPRGNPQRLYPHCLSCSRRQGGQLRHAKG
ncbi:hypothetical protein ENSA7_78970 [Enhygromyxa salina]|uniref:Uncharacterized protein n=1 Tax=Enhygromyxa salina TaxID=215803 RepID=A0A2S9XLV5_9BACT|nr:hypothetical protein ENSA7_78970 [Enhygromyxa salina]